MQSVVAKSAGVGYVAGMPGAVTVSSATVGRRENAPRSLRSSGVSTRVFMRSNVTEAFKMLPHLKSYLNRLVNVLEERNP